MKLRFRQGRVTEKPLDNLTACLTVKLRFRQGRVTEKPLVVKPHCTLENSSDLYVNERQKIRYYHANSILKKEKKKKRKKEEEEEC